jgi:hypothetical protein
MLRVYRECGDRLLHFSNAIRTGTFCCYRPERSLDWEL